MLSYITKLLTLAVFWFFTIYSYYALFPFHNEAFPWTTLFYYIIPLFIIYSLYKVLSYFVFNDPESDKVEISYTSILWYWLLNLLLLCIVYFSTKEWFSWAQWIALFFKIIWFLILPVLIFFSSYWFWNKVLSYINWFEKEESTFKTLSSIWFWFFSFIALFYIAWFLGFYNIYTFLLIITTFLVLWYKSIWRLFGNFFSTKITIEKDINLYTSEFLFVILTALLSANLILIFRPFPIWWDDLGSYMNTPNLLAAAWHLLPLWWMQTWELYTWVWYLFWSTTQAFYLNSFSWFLAAFILYISTRSFFRNRNEFINIPLLLSTIFISMPMVIFQLGKDMKLDIWLFSISIIALYMIYYIFIKKEDFVWEEPKNEWFIDKIKSFVTKKEFFKNEDLIYIFIVWIIVWFAFAIKMTTLMLISAIIWIIIFNRIWILAFLWYLAIYFAIFTKFHLWGMMNVVYPKNDVDFINYFSLISLFIWIWLITYAYFKHSKDFFIKTFVILWVFLCWIFVALLPWFTKNITEAWISNVSIWTILWWKAEYYQADYSKIHSKNEIKEIEEIVKSRQNLDENWQAVNADMWRYFWYEKWINNYLKLPYNLSMQSNQRGEYTDITYIFFALLPVLFLFIPLRNKWFYIPIYLVLIFEILYFVLPWSKEILTSIVNNIEVPLWYTFILWWFLATLWFFKYATDWKDDKIMKLFMINLVFTTFYVFLWNIAAFGIVWYWISMYFSFLIFIWIWLHYITREDKEIDSNDNFYMLKAINFFIVFIIISIYFVKSTIPHIYANFKEDSYMHYKAWIVNSDDAIFAYHSDYLKVLFELNIKEDKKNEFINWYKKQVFDFFSMNNYPKEFWQAVEQANNINSLNDILTFFINSQEIKGNMNPSEYKKLNLKLSGIRTEIYTQIKSPNEEYKSDAIIYRMWTFLRYFITENNKRLLEDSLIFTFQDYLYNDDINKMIDNFKAIWLNYILVDLNTPTIDQDPKHELTNRFENLLKVFTSPRLEVIDSDSVCLKTAIELYNKSNKTEADLENYVRLAWVNFESYDKDNKEINRWEKLVKCYDVINYLINNDLINNDSFSYLNWIKDDIKKQNFTTEEEKYKYMYSKIPAWFKALFKIKE